MIIKFNISIHLDGSIVGVRDQGHRDLHASLDLLDLPLNFWLELPDLPPYLLLLFLHPLQLFSRHLLNLSVDNLIFQFDQLLIHDFSESFNVFIYTFLTFLHLPLDDSFILLAGFHHYFLDCDVVVDWILGGVVHGTVGVAGGGGGGVCGVGLEKVDFILAEADSVVGFQGYVVYFF